MKKILILENGKSISTMINSQFKSEDYKIFLSGNHLGKNGLRNHFYDLIIADLTSIKKEKVELLMQLKNSSVVSMVPFILITSRSKDKLEEQFSFFDYYLTKPFTMNELSVLIKKILNHNDNISPW